MKKLLKTMMVLSVASVALLSSCKKTDDTATVEAVKNEIAVKANGIDVANGGNVFIDDRLVIYVKSTGNDKNALKTMKLTRSNGAVLLNKTTLTGTTSTDTLAWTVGSDPADTGDVTLTATTTGEKGDPATITFVLKVTVVKVANPVIGNQTDVNPKFWSAELDQIKTLSDVKADPSLASKLDICYVTRSLANGGNKIASPASDDATEIYSTQWTATDERITLWNHRNTTMFVLSHTTVAQFDGTGNDQAKIAALIASARTADGEPNVASAAVANGQIFLFKTEKGKYGLLKVNSPTGEYIATAPAHTDPGFVQLDAKYEN